MRLSISVGGDYTAIRTRKIRGINYVSFEADLVLTDDELDKLTAIIAATTYTLELSTDQLSQQNVPVST